LRGAGPRRGAAAEPRRKEWVHDTIQSVHDRSGGVPVRGCCRRLCESVLHGGLGFATDALSAGRIPDVYLAARRDPRLVRGGARAGSLPQVAGDLTGIRDRPRLQRPGRLTVDWTIQVASSWPP